MKILAFVDLHLSIEAYKELKNKTKKHNPDLIICAGDYTVFDNKLNWILRKISKLGDKIFILEGNHEVASETKKAIKKLKNIEYIGKKIIEFKGLTFLGWGGGGFGYKDKQFEKFVKENADRLKRKKIVMVTHGPPYGTKLDDIYGSSVGNKSYKKFLTRNKHKILLYVCGHIHETEKMKQKIGKCLLINPGAEGEIIDLL